MTDTAKFLFSLKLWDLFLLLPCKGKKHQYKYGSCTAKIRKFVLIVKIHKNSESFSKNDKLTRLLALICVNDIIKSMFVNNHFTGEKKVHKNKEIVLTIKDIFL